MSDNHVVMLKKKASAIMVMATVGSGDWSWLEELSRIYDDDTWNAISEDPGLLNNAEEPVTIGDDGRLWDGHHRVLWAWLNGDCLVTVKLILDPFLSGARNR